MRGKGLAKKCVSLLLGITPAYAGKRISSARRSPPDTDHPRLCGEKGNLQRCPDGTMGSPPPMRGKAEMRRPESDNRGITPAYAGKSFRLHFWRSYEQDHPRLCGEKTSCTVLIQHAGGSPPPMRGKGLCIHKFLCCCRITPAYAGKRFFLLPFHHLHQDHPRLCGEKLFFFSDNSTGAGSPPPMRGKDNN